MHQFSIVEVPLQTRNQWASRPLMEGPGLNGGGNRVLPNGWEAVCICSREFRRWSPLDNGEL